ncbi:hypothetical protein [Sphingomonas morindae]|uniref:Uncharacterized protein n=1 Tax=Sphingomonas morindae TaxID=1541170 RepID=A0ABY4X3F1_9SPHN|nr:hypothetical protein [Sphingomonas morindae]USI71422.1 hypothetical protein LHA26_08700 [Sphingomonas morindae]
MGERRRFAVATRPSDTHAILIASAAVRQAGTPTARIAGRIDEPSRSQEPVRALVAALLRADQAAARMGLGGSFHPRVATGAGRRVSTFMKAGFTVGL